MARTQRRFCGRDAAEISAAIHRGRGRRERGRNVGQDRVDMGQRVTGELPRGYLGLKAGLHGGEIGGVSQHAAKSLATLLDHVLPQTAHQGAARVIERQAEVRERRRRRCWGRWIGRRCRIGWRCRVGRGIRSNNRGRLIVAMMVMRMAGHGWLFSLSTGLMVAIDRLLSWRHSADTAADACRSKVIRGRIYVGRFALYVLALALNVSPRRYVPVSPRSTAKPQCPAAPPAKASRHCSQRQLGSPDLRTKAMHAGRSE